MGIVIAIIVSLVIGGAAGFLVARAVFARRTAQPASEEEIKTMVADNDELLEDEKRMIHEVIDLGDMTAEEVMKPRVDLIMVEDTETVRQTVERMQGTGFSRLPIYHEDADHVVGIAYYKNLVAPMVEGQGDSPVAEFAAEALFVPQTKDLLPLLNQMQEEHRPMAIVVDEYGGTGGAITIEDIVEEVVGEIRDETDRERGLVEQVSPGEWVANGSLPVEGAAALGWPVEDSDDYETLAGWLLDQTDELPKVGDTCDVEGYRFRIEGMRRRRIQRVRVTAVK